MASSSESNLNDPTQNWWDRPGFASETLKAPADSTLPANNYEAPLVPYAVRNGTPGPTLFDYEQFRSDNPIIFNPGNSLTPQRVDESMFGSEFPATHISGEVNGVAVSGIVVTDGISNSRYAAYLARQGVRLTFDAMRHGVASNELLGTVSQGINGTAETPAPDLLAAIQHEKASTQDLIDQRRIDDLIRTKGGLGGSTLAAVRYNPDTGVLGFNTLGDTSVVHLRTAS